jgi:SAM-dependent methyltransferase
MKTNDYDYIADLYDTYVPAAFDIPFFVDEARKSPGDVLELMSGTGRVSIPLLEAGIKLTCVDISAGLNAVLSYKLKRRGLKADVRLMDVRELDLPERFGLIIIPFNSFAHITSPDDQRKALHRIRRHLAPGGSFICTLGNPALRRKTVDGQLRLFRRYPLAEGRGTLFLWIMEELNPEDDHVVEAHQFIEDYDTAGTLRSKRLLDLRFRLTGRDEFEDLAQAAGFKVKAFYGDFSYAAFDEDHSPHMIWVLEGTD